jgi:phage-related protein
MTATFAPPVAPGYASQRQIQARVLRADFGDGYSLRAGDGLNSVKRVWSLTWPVLRIAEADVIEAFLTARGGVQPFWWTAPDEGPRQFICPGWSRQKSAAGIDGLTATFEEVFDL